MYKLNYIIWQEWQYFVSQCLNIDISSFWETKEEAISNLEEALSLYFEDNKTWYINEIKEPEIIQSNFSYA